MSCEYCEEDKILVETTVSENDPWFYSVGDMIKADTFEVLKYQQGVFIDRGYLRVVDLDDCSCIEAGEKVKINYCPMCGEKIEN